MTKAPSPSASEDASAATAVPASKAVPAATASASTAASGAADPAPYAIVEACGQQFWLQPNRYYDFDRLAADVDATLTLDEVLLVSDAGGVTVGQPYVKGGQVTLRVLAHRRGPKIIVYKMRKKKKTRRKNGHRQELTRVMVESITVAGKALA
ncbi:MAG: 50S ribosomal protein L21 [Synechococcus sp. Tobar2m-G35]|jgi:large subunit ribosomal protein L21|nr:50S ribosomal protein L21 [Synechococcus sp. Tobar2m-G35]